MNIFNIFRKKPKSSSPLEEKMASQANDLKDSLLCEPFLPAITLFELRQTAPDYAYAVTQSLTPEQALSASTLPRAAWFYLQFVYQVNNGGVIQYFYNLCDMPGFERAPEFIAQNPVLSQALPFVKQAHLAWNDVGKEVAKARSKGNLPAAEKLFKSMENTFDALETEFYAVESGIFEQLSAAINQSPHDYFEIAPATMLPDMTPYELQLVVGLMEQAVNTQNDAEQIKLIQRLDQFIQRMEHVSEDAVHPLLAQAVFNLAECYDLQGQDSLAQNQLEMLIKRFNDWADPAIQMIVAQALFKLSSIGSLGIPQLEIDSLHKFVNRYESCTEVIIQEMVADANRKILSL
jgi:hypothetical protein